MADPILHSADAATLLSRVEVPDPAAIEVGVKAIGGQSSTVPRRASGSAFSTPRP